ncbi:hypothetical protein [Methanoregula sp.]|uniref:hypothetical protein n=1 Tax=Methanoregula sp. TaxID=2052170 RepID=UPI003BB1FE96
MDVIPETISLETGGACTGDWTGRQVQGGVLLGGVLYAYDFSNLVSETHNGLTPTERIHLNETKKTYHNALEQLSRL